MIQESWNQWPVSRSHSGPSRLYQPQAAVLDGTYKIPPIVKTAS